jgi:hypothetical protein
MNMKWDVSSITQLVMAAVAVFTQIWATIHGGSVDPTHIAVGVGLGASAVGHAYHNSTLGGK